MRLEWIAGRHPAPRVVDYGIDGDAQWLLTAALPGEHGGRRHAGAPADRRRSAPSPTGLRAMHAIPIDDFPADWTAGLGRPRRRRRSARGRRSTQPVLVHGDACAPNTLISDDGRWTGNVDFGDLAVGDRWADLAVASLSLDWNFGEGHQHELFDAYGIDPDEERIRYYRALWELESSALPKWDEPPIDVTGGPTVPRWTLVDGAAAGRVSWARERRASPGRGSPARSRRRSRSAPARTSGRR